MKRAFLLLALLVQGTIYAQPFALKDYTLKWSQTNFYKEKDAKEFYIEVTPWVIKGGWYQYFLSTFFTAMWSTPQSLATPYDDALTVGKGSSYGPAWVLASGNYWGHFYDPQYLESPSYVFHNEWKNNHWRRNYNGVFSAHTFYHEPSGQPILFALSHGENKNEKVGSYFYQNTVRPSFLLDPHDSTTYSGGMPYRDCPDAYFGFVNGNWTPYNATTNWGNTYLNDLGPIGWPAAGYLNADGSQASFGLRHPSSIVYGEFLYIFVQDNSFKENNGTKLIRCRLPNVLTPAAYETWSSAGWLPSLPPGFSKERAADFFAVKGPKNTPVFPPDKNTIRFAVARVVDKNEFLGVETYYSEKDSVQVAIRYSQDLIHWSGRQVISRSADWGVHPLKYAVFLRKDGTSNTEIDSEEFYVIGVSSVNTLSKVQFKKSAPVQESFSARPLTGYSGDWLVQVMPNPVYESLSLHLYVPTTAKVQLNLLSSRGNKVAVLMEEVISRGKTTRSFSMARYTPGYYFLELSSGSDRFFSRVLKL